jgi:hypothetical protein
MKTIKIVWRDRDGDAKSIQTVKSNSAGLWSIKCEYDEFVETRDTVKATIGTTSRTFVVPQLTLHIDRSNDTVGGIAPPSSTVHLKAGYYKGDFKIDAGDTEVATSASGVDGTYSHALVGDIQGWDDVYASYTDAHGDVYHRYEAAEGIQAWIGRRSVWLTGNPGSLVSAEVTDNDSLAVIGSVSGSFDYWGDLLTQFLDADGGAVHVGGQDIFTAHFPHADYEIVMPDLHTSVNIISKQVDSFCRPYAGYVVDSRISNRAARSARMTGRWPDPSRERQIENLESSKGIAQARNLAIRFSY